MSRGPFWLLCLKYPILCFSAMPNHPFALLSLFPSCHLIEYPNLSPRNLNHTIIPKEVKQGIKILVSHHPIFPFYLLIFSFNLVIFCDLSLLKNPHVSNENSRSHNPLSFIFGLMHASNF